MPYGGVGLMIPSSQMNKDALISPGVSFRFGYFQPVTKGRPIAKGGYHVGIELRIEYSKFPADLSTPVSVSNLRYRNGGTSPVTVVPQLEAKEKKPDAFHFLIGPSVFIWKKTFFFQPSLLLGYASFAQEPFRYYDTIRLVSDPTQNGLINLYTAPHETNNGFVVVPGCKAGIRLSPRMAAFISADYSFGAKQDFTDQVFVPSGSPDAGGVFDFQQVKNGTLQSGVRQSRVRALSLSLNLGLTFPRKAEK